RPVHAAATQQARVGRVDDRVGVAVGGDVSEMQRDDAGHGVKVTRRLLAEASYSRSFAAAVLTWRSTRRSGTSHISATPTYAATAIQRLTNANPIPMQYSSGEILPLTSDPTAVRSRDCAPSARSSMVCRM